MPRTSGIFCPVSALPGPYGVGDFGDGAERLIDWMAKAGFRYWQILPLTVPDSRGSAYASPSFLFGNWLHISPDRIPLAWRVPFPTRTSTNHPIALRSALKMHRTWLLQIHQKFLKQSTSAERAALDRWRKKNAWIETTAHFFALKDRYQQRPWWTWPAQRGLPDRRLRARMEFHVFVGWLFETQWQAVKKLAHHRNILIVGDMPFYPPLDSVEVWAHQKYFQLNRLGHPTHVAGVPPDPFSSGGQRWGNPVYNWSANQRSGFVLWDERMRLYRQRYDVIRLDHFYGYVATWNIPARSSNPADGKWVASPGQALLQTLHRTYPDLKLLAEDLGNSNPAAQKLRQTLKIPGMRVWVFGWSGLPHNIHHPDEVGRDIWYYSSTHDTNPVRGWWEQESKRFERGNMEKKFGPISAPTSVAIREVIRSPAVVAIFPIQDILNLGSAARLNKPGTSRGNWRWRLPAGALSEPLARRMRQMLHSPSGRSARVRVN